MHLHLAATTAKAIRVFPVAAAAMAFSLLPPAPDAAAQTWGTWARPSATYTVQPIQTLLPDLVVETANVYGYYEGNETTQAVAEAGSAVPASIGPDGVQRIPIRVADDMRFDPPAISVIAGVPLEVTLEGTGSTKHDFSLNEGVSAPVKIVAKGRESAAATFTIAKPGTHSFVCSVPGHSFAGMRGSIVAALGSYEN